VVITYEELQLAARNHGMPLEGLRYDLTPVGMHYLLTHFDVPRIDEAEWSLRVTGAVERPMTLSMDEMLGRPAVTRTVTMECAGNGRARLDPRPRSQPWLNEAVGTASWTGTPLAPILEEAGLVEDAVELVFTGADHGRQGDVEHDYARSLTVEQATRDEVVLAYAINGVPLPPQHGFPLRLVVPGWYGMTSVKWLTSIDAVTEPFEGYQMRAYRLRDAEDDPGKAVTRMQPRALMVPPGFPDFFTRERLLDTGPVTLDGRAWSGGGAVTAVEVSTDGGGTWSLAKLDDSGDGPYAWQHWSCDWSPKPGTYDLLVRATDATGATQPVQAAWNHGGFQNNSMQVVRVTVR